VRFFGKAHIPAALAAAILLIFLLIIAACGVVLLVGPASDWMKRAPEMFEKVERKVRRTVDSAQQITKAAETVQHLAQTEDNETPTVELKKPGVLNTVMNQTKGLLLFVVEVFVLLFFFLAAGEIFVLKLIQILPKLRDKKRAVEIVRETERGISQYLLSMTMVNLFEGFVIGTGLGLLGLPNPLLWGFLAFFANYIPYIGAAAAGSIVTLVALVTFDSVGRALLAPVIYFGVNFSDNFISPFVLGRRLVLNPLIVFVAVMFWGWLWGVAGVLLAVPIVITVKVVCDHIAPLAPFAEFLTAEKTPVADRAKPAQGKA
jgi:predicted PurR-regulated permease PerM